MCSILAILDLKGDAATLRRQAIRLSRLQRHRGPDWSGIYSDDRAILAHERLAIVDVLHGAQPLLNEAGTHVLAVNGEIYNHRELRATLSRPYAFQTDSDCEIILALYAECGPAFLDRLNGIFAFVLYDAERDRHVIARDHVGIVPLYMGEDPAGNTYVASEMKALVPVCTSIWEFPPGHYLVSDMDEPRRYYEPAWRDYDAVAGNDVQAQAIHSALCSAVERQLMSDVPYGVLLSGGLDSSIIAATAKKYGPAVAWWPRLHSFSIGLEGGPDLAAAREAAAHIDSIHHEFHFTVQEGLDALADVIHHIETYDVTTIRAATPMYLMARRIRAMGVKMVLSGEGADEIFGGYLYFHHAPNARAFHEETIRKLDRLHLYDCLRANKAMAAWGVEARVPFLDREFMDVAMSLAPAAKMSGSGRMEKQILRDAFALDLPESIVLRQKEQFSDGVGYGWIDSLRRHAEHEVSGRALATAHMRFPYNTPLTKEAYYYRAIFEDCFPLAACARCVPGGASVACSTPEALAWDPVMSTTIDPSGRAAAGIHRSAY